MRMNKMKNGTDNHMIGLFTWIAILVGLTLFITAKCTPDPVYAETKIPQACYELGKLAADAQKKNLEKEIEPFENQDNIYFVFTLKGRNLVMERNNTLNEFIDCLLKEQAKSKKD